MLGYQILLGKLDISCSFFILLTHLKEESYMTEAAREARNAYCREWYRKNKEKAKAAQQRYWEKKNKELRKEA